MSVGGEKLAVLSAPSARPRTVVGASLTERIFDLAIVIVLMPAILVAGAVIALAIYLDSPGPVMYRSWRVGRDGQPFAMLKFRKMRREAPSHPVTLDDDERFTPIGRFLAATRLDELPQIFNVLRGEMRLVGPRPELECFVAEYAREYSEILTVTPGITGAAQLQFVDERRLLGGPDPESAYRDHLLPAKIEIDLHYARTHNVAGDAFILGRTLLLPLTLFGRRVRARPAMLRRCIPSAAAASLLTLAFVVASSHFG